MKKSVVISAFLALCCSAACFAACGGEKDAAPATSYSSITGNFTLSTVIITSVGSGEGQLPVSGYPEVVQGGIVDYATEAKLRLARDYTYTYTYTINLHNGGWKDAAASLSVVMEGSYEYGRSVFDSSLYTIELADPVSGSIEITGADMYSYMNGNGLNKWIMHSAPDFSCDLGYLFGMGYGVNEYCCGRTVSVDTTDKSLSDDGLFYDDLLMRIVQYNTYQ